MAKYRVDQGDTRSLHTEAEVFDTLEEAQAYLATKDGTYQIIALTPTEEESDAPSNA